MPIVSGFTVTLADRVRETTSTTSTGTYELNGAVSGFRTFVSGIGSGNRTLYTASLGSSWEIGIGTVTSGAPATLSRDQILASSNSGNAVSWGAGTKDIFCDLAATLSNQIWAKPSAFTTGFVEPRGPFSMSGSQNVLDITGIAATARVIHLGYTLNRGSDVSFLSLQLGDSGGLEGTGYASGIHAADTAGSPSGASTTTAFILAQSQPGATSIVQSGAATLINVSGGLWAMHGVAYSASNLANYTTSSGGAKTLSTTLDRLRIGGNSNFVAGGFVGIQIIHAI